MKNFLLFITLFCILKNVSAQTANPQQYKYTFTVAKDGTGEYKFIQDAIDAMRGYPLAPITLYIKNGIYNEKIELPSNNTDVIFIGEDVEKTIITFNDHVGKGKIKTFNSFTAKISGNRFVAKNITFENTAGPIGQALALYVDADQATFINCKFIGNQDTVFTGGETSRQLFKNCFIEGTTDFIFGPATAVFQNCIIRAKSNSYITAANTTQGKKFGLVFLNCKIIADSAVNRLYLGRPWRAYAKTVFINAELPAAIAAAGWDNWSNPENERTVFYAEYKNTGPGAATAKRADWGRQLSAQEIKEYTLQNIFSLCNMHDSLWYNKKDVPDFKWPQKNWQAKSLVWYKYFYNNIRRLLQNIF